MEYRNVKKTRISILVCTLLPLLLIACGGGSGAPTDQGPPLDLIMIANKDDPNSFELFSASKDGTRIEKLSPQIEFPGNDVEDFSISPLGDYVAFRIGYTGGRRLYIVSLDTFEIVQVSEFLGFLQEVSGDYAWSPDGLYLGFIGRRSGEFDTNLYTVRIADRKTTLINATAPMRVPPIRVKSFQWAPDSSLIAYVADVETDNRWELYATSPMGANKRKISGSLVTGGIVADFSWSPNSSMIAYAATQDDPNHVELYRSFSNGSENIKLSDNIGGDYVWADTIEWSPDSSLVQYLIEHSSMGTKNLYVAASDGSSNIKISTNVSDGGNVYMAQWSPNGQRLLFIASVDNNVPYEIYSGSPDGSNLTEISPIGSQLQILNTHTLVAWSPDSSWFAFGGSFDSSGYSDLFITTADGSSLIRVTDLFAQNATLIDFVWSPDNKRMAFRSINMDSYQITLHVVDTVNFDTTFTLSYLSRTALLMTPQWIDQGNDLAFVADLNTLILGELFVSDGVTNITPVSGDFSTIFFSGTGVREFAEIH